MILVDIVNRGERSRSWGEGEYIPREQEHFSRKMLELRLGGSYSEFSRPLNIIDRQVDYIHTALLGEKPTKILEICCGPGFHTAGLAKLGHECVGIDVSPAEIEYAREQAQHEQLQCAYVEHDIYSAQYGNGYGLVMLNFGDFNAFSPMDAYEILGKAWRALDDGGLLLLEPYSFESLEAAGKREPFWEAVSEGLFSPEPYLCLRENIFNDANNSLTKRWYIIDTQSADVRLIAQCYQAYSVKNLKKLLVKRNFINASVHPSLMESQEPTADDFFFISAEKTTKYS